MILSVIPPSVSHILNKILETSKIVDAVRMTKEQFKYTSQNGPRAGNSTIGSDFDTEAFDGSLVMALKRANWSFLGCRS